MKQYIIKIVDRHTKEVVYHRVQSSFGDKLNNITTNDIKYAGVFGTEKYARGFIKDYYLYCDSTYVSDRFVIWEDSKNSINRSIDWNVSLVPVNSLDLSIARHLKGR